MVGCNLRSVVLRSGCERRLVTGFDGIRLEVQDLGSHDPAAMLDQYQTVDESLLNLVANPVDAGELVFDP